MFEYKCNLVKVIDGDTVDVDIDLGFGVWLRKQRIRLYGIDTPESRTRDKIEKVYGLAAKEFLVGFALENDDELSNAKNKLKKKNLDLIVLNSLNDHGAGFGYDTNKVTVICKSGIKTPYKLKEKTEVANDIFKHIIELI